MVASENLIKERLNTLECQFSAIEDDRDDFDDDICRLRELTLGEYEGFLAKRAQTEYGNIWASYRAYVLELVDAYAEAESDERQRMRDSIREFPNVHASLYVLGEEIFWRVRRNGGENLLMQLVTLISMDNSGSGAGGCWSFLLADVYASAEQFGWDESAINDALNSVALISSDLSIDGNTGETTKAFLAQYSP